MKVNEFQHNCVVPRIVKNTSHPQERSLDVLGRGEGGGGGRGLSKAKIVKLLSEGWDRHLNQTIYPLGEVWIFSFKKHILRLGSKSSTWSEDKKHINHTCCRLLGVHGSSVDTWNMTSRPWNCVYTEYSPVESSANQKFMTSSKVQK